MTKIEILDKLLEKYKKQRVRLVADIQAKTAELGRLDAEYRAKEQEVLEYFNAVEQEVEIRAIVERGLPDVE